ncbi:hypothetical protein [Kocuria turfanensis]|uniref:Uncharacterized protein n=1 Tax=Kocuria turfanensis TaxID=388357 RepID=A0A512I9K7_9MICC|nr:hypothetical protein [Kocuria turfanensis]GEO94384.1 hypothetical protein KTU01_05070 [Kocuria turfanensis]
MGADDEAIGHEQARRLRATMVAAGIDRDRLWLSYFSIGGEVSELEVDAYLHHSLSLPPLQRDLLAQAANELVAAQAPPPAPYVDDLRGDRAPPRGDPAGTEPNVPVQDGDVLDRDDPGSPEH